MSFSSPEPPAECPTCGAIGMIIVITGPDAEAIRFTCGCSVPVSVHREITHNGDDTDNEGDDDADSLKGPA